MKSLLLSLSLLIQASAMAAPMEFFSTGEPYFAWEDKSISVCWLNDMSPQEINFSPELRDKMKHLVPTLTTISEAQKVSIKELINKEYTKERTGIRFVGWKNCKDTEKYDVVLMTGDSGKLTNPYSAPLGKANIGRCNDISSYEKLRDDEKSYLYINFMTKSGMDKIRPDELVKLTAVHEFGHLAGLRHEHIRNEAEKDPSCHAARLGESMYYKTSAFSVYDPQSIMNYCFLDFLDTKSGFNFNVLTSNKAGFSVSRIQHYTDDTIVTRKPISGGFSIKVNIGLSKGDLHGLKCLYVYGKDTRKEKCHARFRP